MDGWMDGWMDAWMDAWMVGSGYSILARPDDLVLTSFLCDNAGYSDTTVVRMPTCYPTVILLVIIVRHFRLSYRIRAFHSLSNLGVIEKRKMDLLASYNDENVEDSPSTVSEKQVNRFLIPSKYRFDQIA